MNKPTIKTMPIKELRAAPYNPRRITEEALAGLTASIKAFGLTAPIVWNKRTKYVVSGHQRLEALKRLGEKEAPVMVVDWPETKEKAANLAHNNKAIEGTFTDEVETLQKQIEAADADLYASLLLDEIDAPDSPEEDTPGIDGGGAGTGGSSAKNTGELWECGRHRILCDSSTDPKAVARLMGGRTAQMLFTDPPYGVDYQSKSGKFEKIKGDEKKADDLANKLLLPALRAAVAHTAPDAAFYIWHASSTREDFAHAMKQAGLQEKQYIIWAKPAAALSWVDYQWAHEPCFYACKAGKEASFFGNRQQSTIWRVTFRGTGEDVTVLGPGLILNDGEGSQVILSPSAKGRKLRQVRLDKPLRVAMDNGDVWEVAKDGKTDHPTQKPVALARRAIENSSQEGDGVLDLFLGSGATLLAAEITERRCYGMDIDSAYVAASIDRWQRLTGQKAKRIK